MTTIGINRRSVGKTRETIEKITNTVLDCISSGKSFCISISEIPETSESPIKYCNVEDPRLKILNDLEGFINEPKNSLMTPSEIKEWIHEQKLSLINAREYSHVAALKDLVDLIEGRYCGIKMFYQTPSHARTGTDREAQLMFEEVRIIKECMDITLDQYGLSKKED